MFWDNFYFWNTIFRCSFFFNFEDLKFLFFKVDLIKNNFFMPNFWIFFTPWCAFFDLGTRDASWGPLVCFEITSIFETLFFDVDFFFTLEDLKFLFFKVDLIKLSMPNFWIFFNPRFVFFELGTRDTSWGSLFFTLKDVGSLFFKVDFLKNEFFFHIEFLDFF